VCRRTHEDVSNFGELTPAPPSHHLRMQVVAGGKEKAVDKRRIVCYTEYDREYFPQSKYEKLTIK